MTVYFLRAEELIKIGHADDVERRVGNIAASFKDGAVLLGTVDGGRDVEKALHAIFASSRVEGEWYRPTDDLIHAIHAIAQGDERLFGGSRSTDADTPEQADQAIARRLLSRLFTDGAISAARSLEAAYQILAERNPKWSRRRVRAIWNLEAKRIDHFEIRDLMHVTGVKAADWAEWVAPEISN